MIYLIIAAGIALTDIFIKKYIEKNYRMHEEKDALNGKLKLTRYHNYGAAMNAFSNNKRLLLGVSSVLVLAAAALLGTAVPKKGESLKKLALSFLAGGGASNLYDRGIRGYVVDYFSFAGKVPKRLKKVVFNIADLFIFAGAFLLAVREMLTKD